MRKEKGVTLIALATTVGILLILVSVSVTIAINTGLIGNTENATKTYMSKAEEEQARLQQGKLAMGGSITLEDSVIISETEAGKTLNYKIYGNSVQDGTPTPITPVEIQSVGDKTINVLNHTAYNINYNGVKFVVNSDKSITMNGTATTTFPIAISTNNGFVDGDGTGTYTLCGAFGGSSDTYYLQSQNGYKDTGNGVALTTVADKNIIRLYVVKGAVLDNVTIYPMLIKGNYVNKVPEYEPYGKYKIPIKINDETTNIYLDEPLRKIGDYVDYIDFEQCKIKRSLKSRRLTSDLNWTTALSSTTSNYFHHGNVDDITQNISYDLSLLCSHYPVTIRNSSQIDNTIGFKLNLNGFFITDNTYTNNNSFISFIEDNDIEVIYPCYTEEFIDLPKIKTQDKVTKLEVLTNISPSKTELYY